MLNPDYKDILYIFGEEQVEYLLVGAYALAVHGLPRATGDMDLWINDSPLNAEKVYRALVRFGALLSRLSAKDFSEPEQVIQIGVVPRRIDVLTSVTGLVFQGLAEPDRSDDRRNQRSRHLSTRSDS